MGPASIQAFSNPLRCFCDGRDVVNPSWFTDRYDTPVSLKHGCIEPIGRRFHIWFPITPRRSMF
jgi:hypothetical protein